VEQRFPALRGPVEPADKWTPTEIMIDCVKAHFPDARVEMHDLPALTWR
jgi:hypothetical protein